VISEEHIQVSKLNSISLPSSWLDQWHHEGILYWPKFWQNSSELLAAADAIESLPEIAGRWMQYFEGEGSSRALCRIENFIEYKPFWATIAEDTRLLNVLNELMGEPPTLFKEKINFKLAGGAGFKAHQDAPAFTGLVDTSFITAMLTLDSADELNGALEYAPGSHRLGLLPQSGDMTLLNELEDTFEWKTLVVETGDLVLFSSLLLHRSGPNRSNAQRRAAFFTYNPESMGNWRTTYFSQKRQALPPDCERIPGVDYSKTVGMFNVGNPVSLKG